MHIKLAKTRFGFIITSFVLHFKYFYNIYQYFKRKILNFLKLYLFFRAFEKYLKLKVLFLVQKKKIQQTKQHNLKY